MSFKRFTHIKNALIVPVSLTQLVGAFTYFMQGP